MIENENVQGKEEARHVKEQYSEENKLWKKGSDN
jgi:hypothetical protein